MSYYTEKREAYHKVMRLYQQGKDKHLTFDEIVKRCNLYVAREYGFSKNFVKQVFEIEGVTE